MGVYIKEMEMPISCWRCPFCLTVDPDTYRCIPNGQEFESTFDAIDHVVLQCPLVPVPPHGDLIDRDALGVISWKEDEVEDSFGAGAMFVLERVDELPTIIDAEEE